MQDKDGNALVPLPPVVINVVRVQLDEATREVYNAVERESRQLVQTFYANGGHREDVRLSHVWAVCKLTVCRCPWGSMCSACSQDCVKYLLTAISFLQITSRYCLRSYGKSDSNF